MTELEELKYASLCRQTFFSSPMCSLPWAEIRMGNSNQLWVSSCTKWLEISHQTSPGGIGQPQCSKCVNILCFRVPIPHHLHAHLSLLCLYGNEDLMFHFTKITNSLSYYILMTSHPSFAGCSYVLGEHDLIHDIVHSWW